MHVSPPLAVVHRWRTADASNSGDQPRTPTAQPRTLRFRSRPSARAPQKRRPHSLRQQLDALCLRDPRADEHFSPFRICLVGLGYAVHNGWPRIATEIDGRAHECERVLPCNFFGLHSENILWHLRRARPVCFLRPHSEANFSQRIDDIADHRLEVFFGGRCQYYVVCIANCRETELVQGETITFFPPLRLEAPDEKESLSPLERRDTPSSAERRSLLYIEEGERHSVLSRQEEYASSL